MMPVGAAEPGKPGSLNNTLWNHSELFRVNLRIRYGAGYPPCGEWSVGYIISRKLKRIVGCDGGGWLALTFTPVGGLMIFPPATDNIADIKAHLTSEAMAKYLKELP